MHVTVALLYGATIWLALVALAVMTETGLVALTLVGAPVIISGAMIALFVLDAAAQRIF